MMARRKSAGSAKAPASKARLDTDERLERAQSEATEHDGEMNITNDVAIHGNDNPEAEATGIDGSVQGEPRDEYEPDKDEVDCSYEVLDEGVLLEGEAEGLVHDSEEDDPPERPKAGRVVKMKPTIARRYTNGGIRLRRREDLDNGEGEAVEAKAPRGRRRAA